MQNKMIRGPLRVNYSFEELERLFHQGVDARVQSLYDSIAGTSHPFLNYSFHHFVDLKKFLLQLSKCILEIRNLEISKGKQCIPEKREIIDRYFSSFGYFQELDSNNKLGVKSEVYELDLEKFFLQCNTINTELLQFKYQLHKMIQRIGTVGMASSKMPVNFSKKNPKDDEEDMPMNTKQMKSMMGNKKVPPKVPPKSSSKKK